VRGEILYFKNLIDKSFIDYRKKNIEVSLVN